MAVSAPSVSCGNPTYLHGLDVLDGEVLRRAITTGGSGLACHHDGR